MASSLTGVLTALPASATSTSLYDAGSATTYDLMVSLFGGTTLAGNTVGSPGNTPSVTTITPGATNGGIPTGTGCTTGMTWSTGSDGWSLGAFPTSGSPAPNGSTEGKRALYAEQTVAGVASEGDQSCIDFARSSSALNSSAPNTNEMQYFAYALDAVSVLVGKDATAKLPAGTPAQLDLQQIYGIYTCQLTNWDQIQVGVSASGTPIYGANASIYRFWPQSGSGTLAFMQGMLGSLTANNTTTAFDPTIAADNPNGTAAGDAPSGGNNNCVNGIYGYNGPYVSEENIETTIANSSAAADAGAIMPFSVGKFLEQWNDSNDYNSGGPGGPNGNWDPSLSIANLGGLGALQANGALPYSYGDVTSFTTANAPLYGGNPNYPFAPFIGWTFTSNPEGNPFVTNGQNAVGATNGAVASEPDEFYNNYGTTDYMQPGVRYLYNVLDTALPSYAAALGQVGFTNLSTPTTVSNLCNNTKIGPSATQTPAQIILSQGFLPLTNAKSPANLAGSYCREFQVTGASV